MIYIYHHQLPKIIYYANTHIGTYSWCTYHNIEVIFPHYYMFSYYLIWSFHSYSLKLYSFIFQIYTHYLLQIFKLLIVANILNLKKVNIFLEFKISKACVLCDLCRWTSDKWLYMILKGTYQMSRLRKMLLQRVI